MYSYINICIYIYMYTHNWESKGHYIWRVHELSHFSSGNIQSTNQPTDFDPSNPVMLSNPKFLLLGNMENTPTLSNRENLSKRTWSHQ